MLGLAGADLTPAGILDDIAKGNILAHLMVANLFLVFFNLLPAFPMDGGRVLRALLAIPLGQLQATKIAVALGMGMAGLFLLAGPWIPMLILVAVFVFFAGQQELAGLRYREAIRQAEPLEVLPVEEDDFDWRVATPQPRFSGFTWDSHAGLWIEWRNGRPIHTISVE